MRLAVDDIVSYLASSGWSRQSGLWRGATVWVHEDDHEVIVPAGNGMGDGERRIRGVLAVLAQVEDRGQETIAADIASPRADVQWYRTTVDGELAGHLDLGGTLAALKGAHEALGAVARVAVEGPHAVFDGAYPKEVRDLLARVRLLPLRSADGPLTLRIPLDGGDDPLARRVTVLLQDALSHLRGASEAARATGDLGGFDSVVTAGVSANLCAALARLAGPGRGLSFETGFRWARAVPSPVEPRIVAFREGTGVLLRQAAFRLRRLRFSGPASVTGVIGALYDNGTDDRFRVQVHGEVVMDRGAAARRSLWVRLPDGDGYDLAIEAHRQKARVRAVGALATVNGRLELVTAPGDFHRVT